MIQNKKQAFDHLIGILSETLSSAGCNDMILENTPENFLLLEEAGAINLRMSLEEFRQCSDYDDYKPFVSKDGKKLYTQDFTVLALLKKELGL